MANNTQVLSISAPKVLIEFLETSELSASAIFQEALIEKKQIWDRYNTENAKLLSNIQSKDTLLSELISFIELKGIKYEEFLEWRRENKANHQKENAIL